MALLIYFALIYGCSKAIPSYPKTKFYLVETVGHGDDKNVVKTQKKMESGSDYTDNNHENKAKETSFDYNIISSNSNESASTQIKKERDSIKEGGADYNDYEYEPICSDCIINSKRHGGGDYNDNEVENTKNPNHFDFNKKHPKSNKLKSEHIKSEASRVGKTNYNDGDDKGHKRRNNFDHSNKRSDENINKSINGEGGRDYADEVANLENDQLIQEYVTVDANGKPVDATSNDYSDPDHNNKKSDKKMNISISDEGGRDYADEVVNLENDQLFAEYVDVDANGKPVKGSSNDYSDPDSDKPLASKKNKPSNKNKKTETHRMMEKKNKHKDGGS